MISTLIMQFQYLLPREKNVSFIQKEQKIQYVGAWGTIKINNLWNSFEHEKKIDHRDLKQEHHDFNKCIHAWFQSISNENWHKYAKIIWSIFEIALNPSFFSFIVLDLCPAY